jgi:uncharacterized membrane protein
MQARRSVTLPQVDLDMFMASACVHVCVRSELRRVHGWLKCLNVDRSESQRLTSTEHRGH